MSDAPESPESPEFVARHAACAACRFLLVALVVSLAGACRASAQQSGPQPIDEVSPDWAFLPRANFNLVGDALSGGDPRFSWDTHFGGDADLLDYKVGRLSIVGDYEAVVGSERKNFDVNQGLYTLEASLSGRVGRDEAALVYHHVSRHLSDRSKLEPTAWNVLEVRYLRNLDLGGDTRMAIIAGAGNVITHVDVDYTWNLHFEVAVRHPVKPYMGVFAHGWGEGFGVNPAIRHRTDPQYGGRFEGGVRFEGRAAILELFAGVEHRIDADLNYYLPFTSGVFGFRLANKSVGR